MSQQESQDTDKQELQMLLFREVKVWRWTKYST